MLNRTSLIIGMSVLVFAASAQSRGAGQPEPRYSKTELRQLMQSAETEEQFRNLASYFRAKERSFRIRADEDNQTFERAIKTIAVPKFPAPADTAKWFARRDSEKADQAAILASRYEIRTQASAARSKNSANENVNSIGNLFNQ